VRRSGQPPLLFYNTTRIVQKELEMNMPINSGVPAPDFSLLDENAKTRKLSEFRGQPVVLYFYPKDDTPGCTTEACNFRDNYDDYTKAGVLILGVSPDDPASHAKFKQKYSLPFPLLADDGHKVCDLYGVWGPKKFMGREYEGVLRTTFLVDKAGQIARVFEDVKPAEHSAEVLSALKSL
jgi:thioredoxin-dependent peroxiredoxin